MSRQRLEYRHGTLGLACVEWPTTEPGPALVLLHGLGGNALWWAELAARLPQRHLIAVDLPGFGLSPEPAGDLALPETWAPGPIGANLAALAPPSGAIWLGHSWGGKLAVAAAAASPSTRGLVLLDAVPAPPVPLHRPERTADGLFAGEYGPWPDLASAEAAVSDLPQYQPWTSAMAEAFARGQTQSDLIQPRLNRAKASAALSAMFDADLSAQALSITAPVLDISAGQGFEMSDPNRACFPGAERIVILGNHWLHSNQPDALAHALRTWLSKTM